MTPFNLKIITPNGVFFPNDDNQANQANKANKAEQVLNVIVRTTVGDKGILARHEPYVAALPIGKMRVKDIDGNFRTAAISNGTVRVEENGDTTILVQSCEWSDKIDVSRAETAKEKAEERLSDKNVSEIDYDIAEFKLKRALNRINVSKNN